jgi:hypothetical protein
MARRRPGEAAEQRPLWRRLGWMAALWGASVGVLGLVALAIRWWLRMG